MMKSNPKMNFDDLPIEEQEWLNDYLDGTILPDDFAAFQNRLHESPELRAIARRYLAIDDSLRQGIEFDSNAAAAAAATPWLKLEDAPMEDVKVVRFPKLMPIAAAATIAFLLGSAAMMVFRPGETIATVDGQSAEGFAAVEQLFDAEWPNSDSQFREGDTIGAEVFRLASGTAEIQFFSGAMMTVEGPAEISLKSAWEAACIEGSVRMNVPPAARGFKLQAPSTEIIDLGTEFGLEVRNGKGHVEVFDGEIAIRHHGATEQQLVTKGNALGLSPDGPGGPSPIGSVEFPDARMFDLQAKEQQQSDFAHWQAHRDSLAKDERLIAYYTFDRIADDSLIPDLKIPRNTELDGAVVMAEPVDGRWPGMKSALEFRRPSARVRVNIPGDFSAFTFATWVRIDSLDRKYNALFMGDSYETGEPHWQIRDDGALMLSVMVDNSKPNPGAPNDAGLHRVYFSPPIWEMSMSGQWMHVASVYDPVARAVSHYVNGKQISTQEIVDKFFINTLRIGNAEIGNWGLPFREDPWFAIRNLNGRMDEIAIFDAALDENEIAILFKNSRSDR